VFEFVPTLFPFTLHWNEGVDPPCTGVAVNVTDDPGQKGLLDAARLTLAIRLLFSTIVIVMLDAGLLDVQSSDEVRMQET
jgi:hypothetical protein